jgi:hypothetical protein
MSQGTNQLQLKLFTWGSCQRGYAEIIWPRRVDLSRLTSKDGKHTVEIDEAVIEYDNHDSRKNMHRDVSIRAKKPIIVRYYGRGSCNPRSAFDEVYLATPEKVEKVEPMEKQMTFEEYDGKETATYLAKFITAPDGQEIVLEKVQEIERKINYSKLEVKIQKSEDGKIVISGDTYHIRDRLKKYNFAWSDYKHAWVGDGNNNVVGLIKELKELGIHKIEVEGIDIPELEEDTEATAVDSEEEQQPQQTPQIDIQPQELEVELPETPQSQQPQPQTQLQPQTPQAMEVELETAPAPQVTPTPQRQELVKIYLLAMRLPTKHLLMKSTYERDSNGVLREVRRWDTKVVQLVSHIETIRRNAYERLGRVFCHVEEYGTWIAVTEDAVKEAQEVSKYVIEELRKIGLDKVKNINIERAYGVRVVPIYLETEEARNLLETAVAHLSRDVDELEKKIEEAKQNENKKYLRQLESEKKYREALLESFKRYLASL